MAITSTELFNLFIDTSCLISNKDISDIKKEIEDLTNDEKEYLIKYLEDNKYILSKEIKTKKDSSPLLNNKRKLEL